MYDDVLSRRDCSTAVLDFSLVVWAFTKVGRSIAEDSQSFSKSSLWRGVVFVDAVACMMVDRDQGGVSK